MNEKLMKVYQPTGLAREYAELACNLFNGCDSKCIYCFNPKLLHKSVDEFHSTVTPQKDVIKKIKHDVKILEGDQREILLCFTCDAYSSGAMEHTTTTEALEILLEHGLNVNVLTKGGERSLKDYKLFKRYKDQVRYGISLVFSDDNDSLKYESGAAVTSERIETLYRYKRAGIRTWISLEPIWSAEDACELIEDTWLFSDHYKIGKLNYHPHTKEVDWRESIQKIVEQCKRNAVDYTLKKDTAKLVI